MKNIESFYPLSPMQKGMLFHSLYAPEAAEYFKRLSCVIEGDLNIAAFKSAWQRAVDRHPVLRTAFVWEGVKDPVQVVHQQATLHWDEQDWRGLSPIEQHECFTSYLRADCDQGFDLSKAPLLRCAIIRKADDAHYFVWSFHHIVLDGWSLPLLLEEVFAFYDASHLELSRPRPYRDYIAWLQRQDPNAAERFWREYVRGISAPTPLGVDRTPTSEQQAIYEEQPLNLSADATAKLQTFARRHQLTLNTVVQGAWALLLSRYSGEEDVVFGATVMGRPADLPGVEKMLGVFINTLPVRVSVEGESQLAPWLRELQRQQTEARQFEYSPLVEIQHWSDIPRGQSLFESLVVFGSPASEFFMRRDESLKLREIASFERTNYPLTLMVNVGKELSLLLTYDQQRFEAETINRMLGHLRTLLEGMVASPTQPLAHVSLLTAEERQQLLVEWNDTAVDFPHDACIHELFEQQVERTPEAVALIFEDEQLTYAELNERANQLAHHLRGRGVGVDVLVAVLAERSVEMVVGLLGVLKAGGAYVPLDPSYPQERLAFMLEDSGAPVLLTQERLVRSLPKSVREVVCLDNEWKQIAGENRGNLKSGVAAENLAYVIYTSGSTGKPKGAMNTHRAVCNRLLWMQDAYQLTEADRVLQKTPFSFDVSVWEFFLPLLTGAQLVVALPGGHQDSAYLVDVIARQQITTLHFVPSMLHVFLQEEDLEKCDCIQRVICSGEALSYELQQRFFARMKAELHNLYGPTEAAIDVTSWACERNGDRRVVPIGRPISNIQMYVLDSRLEPVPIGVSGELHIGGIGLARGYLNRPELTAEKFIPDPFSSEPGARLYKTGDLARYLPDGAIEYLRRLDHQVKIRGFRIELGEIEAALSEHPDVFESVVLAREDEPGEKRLVAYLVTSQEPAPRTSELRSFLSERLPVYMMPSAFVMLEAMPLSPNGKVDRRQLPAPDHARPELESKYVAPRTEAEEKLASIWREVLGLEQVGVHDNFFELGGDSIISMGIIARANRIGLRFTAKQLFRQPTIADLAVIAEVAGAATTLLAEQGVVTGQLPLTPIQHWFFEQDYPEPHHFNQEMLLETRQPLHPALMERAVRQLLIHHDALRLRFTRGELGWQQTNADAEGAAPFTHLDLSAMSTTEQRAAFDEAVAQAQGSLDLSQGPLLRVVLFEFGAGKTGRLLIVVHHTGIDGVSWGILLEDLEAAYKQLQFADRVRLPPKTTSFKQWAERLTEYAQSPEVEQELSFWLEKSGAAVRRLPVDHQSGINTTATSAVLVSLSADATRALLQEVPAVYRTQINDVLLTAVAQSFARWTGMPRLLIDVEGHGREEVADEVDLARTTGWFTTIFPVVLEVEPDCDLGTMLKSTKEQLRQIPNHGIGYGLLRYLSQNSEVKERLRAGAQAEVLFNYLGQFDQFLPKDSLFGVGKTAGESIIPFHGLRGSRSRRATRRYLLEVDVSVSEERLLASWTYNEDIHRRETIEKLSEEFVEALRALIAHCQSPEAGGFTPSDFAVFDLDQEDLDDIAALIGDSTRKV